VLMAHGLGSGCASYGFNRQGETHSGSQVMRAALMYLENQVEPGHCCPIVMTAAAIPVLQRAASQSQWVQRGFLDKILAQGYDGRDLPVEQKSAVTMGMSMTEKQGGSDVRANKTLATPLVAGQTGIGAAYSLVGHKVCFLYNLLVSTRLLR
jgi:putative acyl-CoA dehydrogenase